MSHDMATLVAGLVGAVLGAGGAVTTTILTNRSARAARKTDREEDRRDRAAEYARERAGRLLNQGRSAAQEALAITSQFFVANGRAGWEPLTNAERAELQKVENLVELIDSDVARTATRAAVVAIAGSSSVESAGAKAQNRGRSEPMVAFREQQLLKLLRDILGSYLREDADTLATLLLRAQASEQDVAHAHEYFLGVRPAP